MILEQFKTGLLVFFERGSRNERAMYEIKNLFYTKKGEARFTLTNVQTGGIISASPEQITPAWLQVDDVFIYINSTYSVLKVYMVCRGTEYEPAAMVTQMQKGRLLPVESSFYLNDIAPHSILIINEIPSIAYAA
jgi:hypothetical protein